MSETDQHNTNDDSKVVPLRARRNAETGILSEKEALLFETSAIDEITNRAQALAERRTQMSARTQRHSGVAVSGLMSDVMRVSGIFSAPKQFLKGTSIFHVVINRAASKADLIAKRLAPVKDRIQSLNERVDSCHFEALEDLEAAEGLTHLHTEDVVRASKRLKEVRDELMYTAERLEEEDRLLKSLTSESPNYYEVRHNVSSLEKLILRLGRIEGHIQAEIFNAENAVDSMSRQQDDIVTELDNLRLAKTTLGKADMLLADLAIVDSSKKRVEFAKALTILGERLERTAATKHAEATIRVAIEAERPSMSAKTVKFITSTRARTAKRIEGIAVEAVKERKNINDLMNKAREQVGIGDAVSSEARRAIREGRLIGQSTAKPESETPAHDAEQKVS